jgi:tetrahydromethanopterin S-methyltransferase subunit E
MDFGFLFLEKIIISILRVSYTETDQLKKPIPLALKARDWLFVFGINNPKLSLE